MLLVPILAVAQAAPGPAEVGFDASTQVVADVAWDRPPEDRFEVWTRLRADAAGPAGEGRWRLGVYGEHQVLIGFADAGGDVEAAWDVRPWESGWEGPLRDGVWLKAGHLVERWGSLDLLPVTDVLVGRDLRAGLLTPPALVRQPAPMARLQVGGERARAELTVLPFGATDRVAVEGTDQALIRQGQLSGALREAATWQGDALTTELQQQALTAAAAAVDGLDTQLRRALFTASTQAGRPDPLAESADVAVRVEGEPGRVSVAAVGAWMRNRRPTFSADPQLVALLQDQSLPGVADAETLLSVLEDPLTVAWPRTWVGGAEMGGTLGAFGVRGEGLFQSDKSVQRQGFQAATSPSVSVGLGVDRAFGTRALILVEARYERLLDLPPDALLAVQDDAQVALGGRVGLAGERVQLEPGAVALLSFGEVAARMGASWRISDAWALEAGGLMILSETPAPRSLDEVLAFSGGPLGALSDTDCVWLTARWIR